MQSTTIYIGVDLETVGGNPADLPVINWGFVAYTENREKLGELSVNTKAGENANPDTVKWWHSTPELEATYLKCTENPVEPKEGMIIIRDWITKIVGKNKAVLVAYPTIFDGSLLYYYWFFFLGHPSGGKGPGFSIIDIRSYGSGKLGCSYFDASKEKALAPYCPKDRPHTHTGLDDAEEQMHLFFNIRDGCF